LAIAELLVNNAVIKSYSTMQYKMNL